jgi:hypothetical protein
MHPWSTFVSTSVDDPEERDMSLNYFRAYIPSMSPREALQPLINKFRRLEYLSRPPWAGTEHELIYEDSPFDPALLDRDSPRYEQNLMIGNEWLALRHLKETYLECGWDVEAVVQTGFRREEFLEKRRRYLDVVYADRLDMYRTGINGVVDERIHTSMDQ